MYPKLALSRDVHRDICLASMVKFEILVIAMTYMSMTCIKTQSLSLVLHFQTRFNDHHETTN